MNRPRLSKSGIEYLDYAWNFYSGCLNGQNGVCPVGESCWAKKITERFKSHYPNGFEPTFYPKAFLSPLSLEKPSRIGVCFMGDLFGDWVDPDMDSGFVRAPEMPHLTLRKIVFHAIGYCPQHTFLFLTKNPAGYLRWGKFPNNCWLGTSLTGLEQDFYLRVKALQDIQATVKFISFEPLLTCIGLPNRYPTEFLFADGISRVIIGSQTKPYRPPEVAWVKEIVEAADKAGAKVFLKENLRPLLYQERNGPWGRPPLWAANSSGNLRQELPV